MQEPGPTGSSWVLDYCVGLSSLHLPAVVKLLEIHGAVSLDLLLRIWENGRPPGKGECEIRFQQLDLNAFGLDEPHRTTITSGPRIGIFP